MRSHWDAVICSTLLKSGLVGYCASSSTVIGQIHRAFLPITGSQYLNDFSSEADKSAFLLNSSICCVLLHRADQATLARIQSKTRCITMEIVQEPLRPLLLLTLKMTLFLESSLFFSRYFFVVIFKTRHALMQTCTCSFTYKERMEEVKVDLTQQCHLARSTVDSAKLKMLISSLSTR